MMNEPEVGGMRQEDYSKDWVMQVYHIYRKEDIGTSKLVRRSTNTLYQLPRPAIKAYEVGFLHAGGDIPCRPYPAAQLVDSVLGVVFIVAITK